MDNRFHRSKNGNLHLLNHLWTSILEYQNMIPNKNRNYCGSYNLHDNGIYHYC